MPQSVKLNDDLMALVRRESELQSRSLAGQIAHWVRIGRAVERAPDFDHARVRAALEASMAPEELGPEEGAVWLDAFADRMAEPSAQEQAFFETRARLGRGVGLSEGGEILRAEAETGREG